MGRARSAILPSMSTSDSNSRTWPLVELAETIGATVEGPAFAEYQPIIREAGRTGLDAD